jgi:hypothetical protein
MRKRLVLIALAMVAFGASPGLLWAQGGPPMLTDDPGTPGIVDARNADA